MSNDQQYNQDGTDLGNWRETFVSRTYRLFKLSRIHELDNEAAQSALESTAQDFQEILSMGVEYMDVIFAGDNIFVNGKPLRANREVYTTVLEMGDLLREVQLNEITIRQGVEQADLEAMLREYLARREDPSRRDDAVVEPSDAIRYRRIDPKQLLDLDEESDQTADEQVMQLYPAAVVTMRRFVDEIKEQKFRGLRFIKRVSQRLVALSDSAPETLLAVTAMRKTRDDEGGISVNSGILAMLMGRHLTDSYRTLQRLCFGGMIVDIGRPRAAGIYKRSSTPNVIPNLNMSGKESLGPSNALLLFRNSRLREPTLRRATIGYEAGWLRYEHDIGWPHGDDRRPTIEAFIVRVSRRFWELMALKPSMKQRRTPKQVFKTLLEEADSSIERAVVRLLMETLGYYEKGTMVETSKGWRGVVVEPGRRMDQFPRPVVRVVRDPNGNAIDAQDLDLSDDDLDIARFGLVRRRLGTVNDDRLRKTAREIRPDDWSKRHGRPSKKSRKRSNPRSPSKKKKKKRKRKKKQKKQQKRTPDTPSKPDSPNKPDKSSKPQKPNNKPGAATSQELSAAAKKNSANADSSPPGINSPGSGNDSAVLEFGPGSTKAKRTSEVAETEEPSTEGRAPSDRSPSAPDEEPASTIQEISTNDIEPASDEQSGEDVQSISPDAIEPTGEEGDDGLLRDHIQSVQDQEADEPSTEQPSEVHDPNQLDPAELSGETDINDGADEGGGAIAPEPPEPDAGDGGAIAPEPPDQESGDDASATPLGDFDDVAHDDDTQQVSAEQSAQVLGDFVDDDVAHDDATQQVSAEKSAETLGDFVDDMPDDSAGPDDATRQIDSNQSKEVLGDFVDDTDDGPQGPPEPKADGGAPNLTEDTSPEEVEKTEQVSADKSQEMLEDFVDDAGSGVADEPESDSTEAMSSEQSEELLQSFVDEPDDEEPAPSPEPIDDPNDSKLGQLASDIENDPSDVGGANQTVSTEKSHELMRDFVEDTPDDSDDPSREQPAGDAPETGDGSQADTNQLSRDEIEDFFEEKHDDEKTEDDATQQMDAEQSAEILQDYVDEDDEES